MHHGPFNWCVIIAASSPCSTQIKELIIQHSKSLPVLQNTSTTVDTMKRTLSPRRNTAKKFLTPSEGFTGRHGADHRNVTYSGAVSADSRTWCGTRVQSASVVNRELVGGLNLEMATRLYFTLGSYDDTFSAMALFR
jgi:hypothetical protein